MSKRSGSEKRKAKAKRLGVPLHQIQKAAGRGWSDRRRKKAELENTTVAAIRRENEFQWTGENRRNQMLEQCKFDTHDLHLKGIGGNGDWNRRLFAHLNSMFHNNFNDYRTRIGDEIHREQFKDTKWSIRSRGHILLGAFEEEHLHKIRSRSTYVADDYLKILTDWNVPDIADSDLITKAFLMVSSDIPFVSHWEINDLSEAIRKIDKGTNAGYPWMTHKWTVLTAREREDLELPTLESKLEFYTADKAKKVLAVREKVLNELPTVIHHVNDRLRRVNSGEVPRIINITGLRTESSSLTQDGKDPYKQRLVWQIPFDHVIIERLFCGELQENIIQSDTGFSNHYWSALERKGQEVPRGTLRILGMQRQAEDWGTKCMSIDYSAFDKHITPTLMKHCVRILQKHANLTDNEKEYLLYGLLDSELWSAWGVMRRHSGIPSGSFFTNLLDSVINAGVCEAVGIYFNTEIDYVVNGDDCVFISEKPISMRQISKVGRHFGMEMHTEKQWIHDHAFLFNKRVFSRSIGGSTPFLHRVLNSIMRHDQRKRILMDLEEVSALFNQLRSLENHPYRDEFLNWLLFVTRPDEANIPHRLDPMQYQDRMLPPIQGYKAEELETDWRSVETYDHDWFWNRCCSVEGDNQHE